jgi:hypothetical protein
MVNFELHGLTARQQFLADIMWQLEEYDDVEAFIATLPDLEACECRSIIEIMQLALVEQCADGEPRVTEAAEVLDKFRL